MSEAASFVGITDRNFSNTRLSLISFDSALLFFKTNPFIKPLRTLKDTHPG